MDRALRILVQHHRVRLPSRAAAADRPVGLDVLATLASNLSAFGFALSRDGFAAMRAASDGSARAWWEELEPVLMDLTGADRKMEEHVVYKNFPHEVLAMSEADYWMRQILMYWGLPDEWFTEKPVERPLLDERLRLKVLHPAAPDSLAEIFAELVARPARWTGGVREDALFLARHLGRDIDLSIVAFKENMVHLAVQCLDADVAVRVDTATDVLRLAVGMSGGDVALREKSRLRSFARRERRFLLSLLESAENLEEDMTRRPELFKRLVHTLHPGDFVSRFPRVVAAADALYKNAMEPTFNAVVERMLRARDPALLDEMARRPGEMMRRLHHLLLVYGDAAAAAFAGVLPRLTLMQLLKIERYLRKVNDRSHRTFPPRGDWGLLQIIPADPRRRLPGARLSSVLEALAAEIRGRMARRVDAVQLAPEARLVKLPTSDSELLPYGRGTIFPLPPEALFMRTAVYWKSGPTGRNIWYDNGWNFFDEKWANMGACCWNETRFRTSCAIFSGDPTNSKDLDGRACQMIDLYLNKLAKRNVRYAVWNVLCYSRIAFDDAEEVFAALQWGADPVKGRLFEPARCQLAFPVKGAQFTKYVAFIDLRRRQLVYIDANLRANVRSAGANGGRLTRTMPAFVEYLDSLPSVHDVFAHLPASASGLPVLYSDAAVDLTDPDADAYVFRPEREGNRFRPFPLQALLS
jgi:hypothetical protein